MLVKNLCAFKADPLSWKRLHLAFKVALSIENLLVVHDKSIGVAPLGDVVMVTPVLAIVCHNHLLTVLIVADCAQLTVLQFAGFLIRDD